MPTIPQLPSIAQLGSSDVFAVSANGVTYKCTGAQLTAALASIGAYITEDQLANNLTTTAEGLALDARQGKALSDSLAVLGATVTGIGNTVSALGDPITPAHGGLGTASAPVPGGVVYGASQSAYGSTPAGTVGQFLRSDGAGAPEWVTVDKTTVGLGNVDNTSDLDKPISTATRTTLEAGTQATKSYHLGFYLDANGDLCYD